jgi:hypothetical protein
MTIDDFDEYECESDEECDCGDNSCSICNKENSRPLTDEEEEALDLLENKNDIGIKNRSYRHEGEYDYNRNLILISNDDDECKICLNIRELSGINKNKLDFIDPDENDYTVIIEDENEDE